ncbi:MAG: hypothetical protein AAE977_00520 [Thermoplasmataceae archaeon]
MVSKDDLRKYYYIFTPMISILVSLPIIYYSITEAQLTVLLIIPIIVFAVMHYLGPWRVKRRILIGFLIFIVLAIFVSYSVTESVYNYEGHFPSATLKDGKYIDNAFTNSTTVNVSLSPYSGVHDSYNFSFLVSNNITFSSYGLIINSEIPNHPLFMNLTEKDMHYVKESSHQALIYYDATTLSEGSIYNFTFYIGAFNESYATEPVGNHTLLQFIPGPYVSYAETFYVSFATYFAPYMILYNLIFITGTFVARSISNSRRYQKPPVSQPPLQPPQ